MPKPGCLSPAANSLYSRIAGRQVPKPEHPVTTIPRETGVTECVCNLDGLLVAGLGKSRQVWASGLATGSPGVLSYGGALA